MGLGRPRVTERLIVLVDTLLVCLGVTMTVAAIGPLLELTTERIWRRRTRSLYFRENAR